LSGWLAVIDLGCSSGSTQVGFLVSMLRSELDSQVAPLVQLRLHHSRKEEFSFILRLLPTYRNGNVFREKSLLRTAWPSF
jgi:hypothetical protein